MDASESTERYDCGIGLEDDPVLIRLREDGRDDPLAEGVVQRVVDRAHADAEARGAVAVDGDVGGEAVVLLIADHIGELAAAGAAALTSFGVQADNAAPSALSRVNWY